ncbi:adenylate/guanylate cyclase domain-containing protein [Vineibacter terrae]|uniref:Adenylate/guanylate cyclase domain-containing protein n=1 Tax=Vineibacter terrae TaxID=2586908 RepID=A0A5C8P931_9HYPH|nr:adenylate/guanylate cyclase domain-containing protein [Vineibacter terrae]TXL70016.1 adenylate/guanylate cyclase domain-containing protein [Vineibacter terrae]
MNEARVERRLAAIVCADVVGYSRLVGADEAGTVAAWRAHREAILPLAAAHRGRLVGSQGDGLLFEFASIIDAVAGALAIQATMAARGAAEPEPRRFRLRIGINLGDIIVDGSDILGDGVNVAARLEALAEPGTICVSGVVREQVQGKLPVAFDDLGPRSVKNIARAVHAWRVRPADSAAPRAATAPPGSDMPARTPSTAPPRQPATLRRVAAALAVLLLLAGAVGAGTWLAGTWPWSAAWRPAGVAIIVLPFESPAGQDQEYFSDGITEDIITALSKMAVLANQQNLRVFGRSTSFAWKGRKADIRQLARELGITHALVGSVRRDGGRLRISAELIDAWTGRSDWAERYDREAGAVFDIQDEVTGRVVSTLVAMLDVTSGRNNPLANPSGKGDEPKTADAEAEQRRQEAEARARAAEARRKAEEAARRQDEQSPKRPLRPAPGAAPAPAPAPSPPSSPPPSSKTSADAAPTPPPAPAAPPTTTLVTRPPPDVYDLVLQARLLAGKDARAALLQARSLLLRATAAAPGYVPAQLALADTYLAAYERRWDPADGAPEGLETALRGLDGALALTPDAPLALALRSAVLAHLGRHDDARDDARRAVGAKDTDAAVLARAAGTLVLVGDSPGALAALARARQRDPVPGSAALSVEARALFLLGRDAEAAKAAEACRARAASDRDCLETSAAALARQGKLDAARAALATLKALDPTFTADSPRLRFARSYRNGADIDAVVAALRQASP